MKKLIFIIFILLIIPVSVFAQQDLIDEQSHAVGVDELSDYYDMNIKNKVFDIAGDFNIDDTIKSLYTGQSQIMPRGILGKVIKLLFNEIYINMAGIIIILLI